MRYAGAVSAFADDRLNNQRKNSRRSGIGRILLFGWTRQPTVRAGIEMRGFSNVRSALNVTRSTQSFGFGINVL
jgi:hypothetical protein